jgi:hypothetical protein
VRRNRLQRARCSSGDDIAGGIDKNLVQRRSGSVRLGDLDLTQNECQIGDVEFDGHDNNPPLTGLAKPG